MEQGASEGGWGGERRVKRKRGEGEGKTKEKENQSGGRPEGNGFGGDRWRSSQSHQEQTIWVPRPWSGTYPLGTCVFMCVWAQLQTQPMRLSDSAERCPCEGYFQSSGSRLRAALLFKAETGWGREANEGGECLKKKKSEKDRQMQKKGQRYSHFVTGGCMRLAACLRWRALSFKTQATLWLNTLLLQLQEHIKCFTDYISYVDLRVCCHVVH